MRHLSRLLVGLLVATSVPALAALGAHADSVNTDAQHFHAARHAGANRAGALYTLTSVGGVTVKEYVNKANMVYAVSWQGRWRPDLNQLLGNYFPTLQSGIAQQMRPGTGSVPLVLRNTNLVAKMGGRFGAFRGMAYLPQQLPQGVTEADIQ